MKNNWETLSELPDGIRFMRDGKKILITTDGEYEVRTDIDWPAVPSMVMTINGRDRR